MVVVQIVEQCVACKVLGLSEVWQKVCVLFVVLHLEIIGWTWSTFFYFTHVCRFMAKWRFCCNGNLLCLAFIWSQSFIWKSNCFVSSWKYNIKCQCCSDWYNVPVVPVWLCEISCCPHIGLMSWPALAWSHWRSAGLQLSRYCQDSGLTPNATQKQFWQILT